MTYCFYKLMLIVFVKILEFCRSAACSHQDFSLIKYHEKYLM